MLCTFRYANNIAFSNICKVPCKYFFEFFYKKKALQRYSAFLSKNTSERLFYENKLFIIFFGIHIITVLSGSTT